MSEFVFNLNGSILSTETQSSLLTSAAKFESALNKNVPNDQLTYTGNDNIVWDRVNGERLRRGLPSLTELGYPRPPEDTVSGTTFNNSDTPAPETFKVTGPPGMTLDQARAIFKQQLDTGSLTGFKVGDALSAATQAADGLAAAAPQLSQGLASAAGLLPKGIDTSTINSALGPGAAAATNQISTALTGVGPAIASFTTGASAGFASLNSVLPGAIATAQANLPGELARAQAALPGALAQISGTVTSSVSIAANAIKSLSSSLGGTPTNGIDISNLAKQTPGLGGIGNLSPTDVTATLAQASKLVGQGAGSITNELGLGKFGFDASQLERAGFVKPGTAAQFLNQGTNELTDVLKSPTVWTGKDGIKGIDGLLNNSNLQNKIQQDLMASGLGDLKQIGIPTDKLTPQALSGLATNAAKSVEDAAKWATGGAGLPAGIKSSFDSMASNGAFAVNLAQGNAEQSVLKERVIEPSSDTVNAATVDAAAARIVGNDKVPAVTGGAAPRSYPAIRAYADFIDETIASFQALLDKVNLVNSQSATVTQDQWNLLNNENRIIRSSIAARIQDLFANAQREDDAIANSGQTVDQRIARKRLNEAISLLSKLDALGTEAKAAIQSLANKIAT